jgi:hypothetical protein
VIYLGFKQKSKKGKQKMDKLQIVNVNSESRIDSRLIAQSLGIDHQNLMQTIEKYEIRIKALGISLFQTDKPSWTNVVYLPIHLPRYLATHSTQKQIGN